MITMNAGSERRLYRDADRAILGGVCAGLAGYLGFNLKMTRFLAFIAFLMAMPIAVIGYLAAVFLIPSASNSDYVVVEERRYSRSRKSRKKKEKAEIRKPSIADDVNRRCESLDERLVRLEKRVTSRRFQLEQELSKL
jgi:phage shock protein C